MGVAATAIVGVIIWLWPRAEQELPPATPAPSSKPASSVSLATSAILPTESPTFPARVSLPATGSEARLTAVAQVTVGREVRRLRPNQVGYYPRVLVPANAQVPVTMTFTDGEVGEPVAVAVQDSGRLVEDQAVSGLRRLDAARQVAFTVQMREEPGIYRVSVRKGGEMRVLEFWVGKELPVRDDVSN